MILESPANAAFPSTLMSDKSIEADKEKPPAYSPVGDDFGSGSAHGSLRERRDRPVPPPPAQHPSRHGHHGHHGHLMHQHHPHHTPPHSAASSSAPSPSVDQVHIFDRKHNIEGTYHIDPLVPMLDTSKMAKSKPNEPYPNASFRTHNNTIDLQLATTGDASKSPKAIITVGSRAGLVKVTLLSMPAGRPRIKLNVFSRQGNAILFLPLDFVGVVQLSTKKGAINILPCMARHMKTVRSAEREMLLMIGNADKDLDGIREVSYCDLSSRTGDIILGIDGQDQYIAPVGFWKKLGGMMKGNGQS